MSSFWKGYFLAGAMILVLQLFMEVTIQIVNHNEDEKDENIHFNSFKGKPFEIDTVIDYGTIKSQYKGKL